MALLGGPVVSACGLGADSALREPQASPGIGAALAFAVQATIALGGAFFRRAALVLDFDAAFFLRFLAGRRCGFFACGAGHARSAQQPYRQANAQE